MGRLRDATDIPNTCPMIDEVISFIDNIRIDWEDEYHTKKELLDIMERIRTSNQNLRDFGNEQYYRAEELESDLEYFKSINEDLERDISRLENEISEVS